MRSALLAAVLVLLSLTSVLATQWPQFRGPGSTGVSTDARPPESWSSTNNVVWRTAIPGVGWSSPIVAKNTIFLTAVSRAQEGEAPKPGLYFGGERPAPTDEHRWIVVAVDF